MVLEILDNSTYYDRSGKQVFVCMFILKQVLIIIFLRFLNIHEAMEGGSKKVVFWSRESLKSGKGRDEILFQEEILCDYILQEKENTVSIEQFFNIYI